MRPDSSNDLSNYTDAGTVSSYAQQAMAWCVEQGIIGGTTTTTLSPQGPATRAQVATRVKLEYYRLEKAYEGAIELESKPGSWKPTQPKRAGGQKDRTSPLDEIIQRINEEFYGEFTDADRVMVDTLYQKMRKDSKAKKAAKTEDRQVYERSLFPGIFDTTAQEAYMENTAAYEQLFLDADKYQAVMRALADRLYKELHDDK